jgi:hypothetical protein
MKTYAVLNNNVVENVIVAPSLEIAESITSSTCIFVTSETGNPYIGLSYAGGVFEQPPTPEAEPEA